MKSYNHLWEKYISEENYYEAVSNATKKKGGKRRKNRLRDMYKKNVEINKNRLLSYAQNYRNDEHIPKKIYDGIRKKVRYIIVPSMSEQVVHHMIVDVLKPIFLKGMYEHSYGSIPGRGAHLAKQRLEKYIRNYSNKCKYVLKMDIKKYFDSIPHDILKNNLGLIIHDARFLEVLYTVIDVVPGDHGIPLGFYTSQWFANWYLQGLDHYIKEVLKAKCYFRYMDDMVIIGPNKRELHKMRELIEEYLETKLGLQLKENWQVYQFDYSGKGRDIDFMGFRFFRDRTILRKSIVLKAMRKARRIAKKGINIYTARQMLSYLGWIDATDTYKWYLTYIKPFVSFRALRHYVSRWQINQLNEAEVIVI